MKFEPLVRCEIPGCPALVESWIARCGNCERKHGVSPNRTGRRGMPKPQPNRKRGRNDR